MKCVSPLVSNENTSNKAEYNDNSNDSTNNIDLFYTFRFCGGDLKYLDY